MSPTRSTVAAMSDETTGADADEASFSGWSEDTDPDGLKRKDFEPRDWLLEVLLDYALGRPLALPPEVEADPPSFGATFNTRGMVVSGLVVHSEVWMRELKESLTGVGDGAAKLGEHLGLVWEGLRDRAETRRNEREAANLPLVPRGYICMKNVTLFTPSETLHLDFWRLRMRDVNGWSLGSTLQPS